jgi:hypothetical protein
LLRVGADCKESKHNHGNSGRYAENTLHIFPH